jgi:hypothetical protein
VIIGTHIPKTGGTSFLQFLRQTFGRRLYHDLSHLPNQRPGPWQLLARLCGRMDVPFGTRCIFGHFRATKYDRVFPRAQHFTWLRDPVERVVSQYHYQYRQAQKPDAGFSLEPMRLGRFVRFPGMRNNQAYYLNGKPIRSFAFVGITEYFDVSLQLFMRLFDCARPSAAVPLANQNPERSSSRYAVSPDGQQLIRSFNQQDVELYQDGLAYFQELCRRHGLQPEAPPTPAAAQAS